MKTMLILGGTRFVGRVFCERVVHDGQFDVTLLNRGESNPELFPEVPRIVCDRDDANACRENLNGHKFDYVVDFSGWQHQHIENVTVNCQFGHYTLLSSSAVDLSWPEDELFAMAQNKLWCEHLLAKVDAPALIVRPGFVVGKYDNTDRFERKNEGWVWKGTSDPVRPLIEVDFLVGMMLQLIGRNHLGILRAGYSKPNRI